MRSKLVEFRLRQAALMRIWPPQCGQISGNTS